MNVIISFEIKKFLCNRKNLIVAILLAACVLFFLLVSNSLDNSIRSGEINIIQMNIDGAEKVILNLKKMQGEQTQLYDRLSESIVHNEKSIKIYKDMYSHIMDNNRLALLDDKIAIDNIYREIANADNTGNTGINIEELKKDIALLEYLRDNKMEQINETASIKADNAIILLLGFPAIIILIIAVFMCADIMASEFDNRTSYVLFSQPIKKSKIFFGKFIISNLLISLFITLFLIAVYIALTFIKGGLQFKYPYMYFDGVNNTTIPAILFIALCFVLLFLLITFVISMTFFVSSIFKNTLATVSVTTVALFLFYILSSKGFLGNIAHLSPFSYLNISSVINGETAQLFNNTSVVLLNGIIVLIVSILILMISSFFIFIKNTNNI